VLPTGTSVNWIGQGVAVAWGVAGVLMAVRVRVGVQVLVGPPGVIVGVFVGVFVGVREGVVPVLVGDGVQAFM